jgi:hypothetical protein
MRDLMRLSKKDSRHKHVSWEARKTVSRKVAGLSKGKSEGNTYQGSRNR